MSSDMENLAKIFDQPFDSVAHRQLAEEIWLGGEGVSIRYWLGRLVHRNLFRESDEAVESALRQQLKTRGCAKGAALVVDRQSWTPIGIVLQHDVDPGLSTRNPKLIAAINAVLHDPELTDAQVASAASTTPGQVVRMSDVFVLRKIWKQQHPTSACQDSRQHDESPSTNDQ